MAFCSECGTQVADGVQFCTSCGKPMGARAAAAAPASAAAAGGLADNVAGLLAYLTIIPAIIFLVIEPFNKNRFVRFHEGSIPSRSRCLSYGANFRRPGDDGWVLCERARHSTGSERGHRRSDLRFEYLSNLVSTTGGRRAGRHSTVQLGHPRRRLEDHRVRFAYRLSLDLYRQPAALSLAPVTNGLADDVDASVNLH